MDAMMAIGTIVLLYYRINDILACGGQSLVYEGMDTRTAKRVVIKQLSALPSDKHYAQELARFKRAAGLKIGHPRVLDPLHSGEENGNWFIIYPYVEGQRLDDYVAAQGGRLSVADALSFACDLAEALIALHARGIVHRDFKPANVIIGLDGRAVLIDLGICRILDQPTITQGTGSLGSPPWIPPEQQQAPSTADPRCDLHALGLLIGYMLTGQQPSASGQPPYCSLQQVDPAIPAQLDQLCQKLTATDPGARPQTAREVLSTLQTMRVSGGHACCTSCGQPVSPNTRYCLNCGALQRRQPAASFHCLACGAPTSDQSVCSACHRPFSASRHSLRFTSGRCAGRTYLVPEGRFEVGREQLDPHDPYISRRHFLVTCVNGSVLFKDAGSANSTLIAGQPAVQPVQLQPGQEIRIAGYTAIYNLLAS